MKRTLLAAFAAVFLSSGLTGFPAVVTVAPALAQDSAFLVQDGLRLPRSHQYELYNPDTGVYGVVTIESVPARVKQGRQIYDRTANAWVSHPSVGNPNPQFAAAGRDNRSVSDKDMLVQDGLRLPRSHKYELHNPDTDVYGAVTIESVPARVKQGKHIYDRTANAWVAHPSVGSPNPQYTTAGASAASAQSGVPQTVSGRVVWVADNDNRMVMRTRDGREINVRLNRLSADQRKNLEVGDQVSVTGREAERRNNNETVLVAESLTSTRRNAAPASSASGDQHQQWSRIHGHVEAVNEPQTQLRFKADDGRVLNVETKDVNPVVRQALTQGEGATVIGFAGEGNRFDAQYIQQDSSDTARGGTVAASPVSERPRNREDCDRGWAKYKNPGFKNHGDCVSSVRGR